MVKDPNRFFDIIYNKENDIRGVRSIGERCVAVSFKRQEEFVSVMGNTNVVIASFVTAQARLKLYSYIERLQERLIYFDTDSIIFYTAPGDTYVPQLGEFLGDLTDELNEYPVGSQIIEFVSGGPKNYGMRIWTPKDGVKTIVKVKGFSLNHQTAAQINFERMKYQVKRFVEDKVSERITVVQPEIRRTKEHELVTVKIKKDYRVVYDKRMVLEDYNTLPWGY